MDEFRWVITGLVGIQMAVIGFLAKALWAHVLKCSHVAETLGGMAADIKRIQIDVGDHEHGIRGQLHGQAGTLTRHEMEIESLRVKRAR